MTPMIVGIIYIMVILGTKVISCMEIEGVQLIGHKKANGVTSYFNIRYARASRFQPPQLLNITEAVSIDNGYTTKFPQVYDVSENRGSSCPQNCADIQQTLNDTFLCKGTEEQTQSETCLTLNIFTQMPPLDMLNQVSIMAKQVSAAASVSSASTLSQNSSLSRSITSLLQQNNLTLRPVYVFLHGGLYLFGSSNSDINVGDKLAESGAVIVTVNYRLGIFGWLKYKNIARGNMSFLDQRVALQWVQKYISYFGGNPDKVVLAGHSAGAKAVLCHATSPESTPYFSGIILHSGALTQHEISVEEAEAIGEIAEQVAITKCPATILSCNTAQLLEIQKEVRSQLIKNDVSKSLHSWSPVIDGYIIQESCSKRAREGKIPDDISVVLSTTNMEGVQFFRSFTSYLPSFFRSLATSSVALRYLLSRIFGPKAGDAFRIYTNQSVRALNLDEAMFSNITEDNSTAEAKGFPSPTSSSSSGFNLFGNSRDGSSRDEKVTNILEDPVTLAYSRLLGDFIYSCPVRLLLKRLSRKNSNIYAYFTSEGFKWAENLKKPYDDVSTSFLSDALQFPKLSIKSASKGLTCQSDDVACKTFVNDCSDPKVVCHLEDLIWLFHTAPIQALDFGDKQLQEENTMSSNFFPHLLARALGTKSLLQNKQIFRKTFSTPTDAPTSIIEWDSFSNSEKILEFNRDTAKLINDFKTEECDLWEWRDPELSMSFSQLIDSRTLPNAETTLTESSNSFNFNILNPSRRQQLQSNPEQNITNPKSFIKLPILGISNGNEYNDEPSGLFISSSSRSKNGKYDTNSSQYVDTESTHRESKFRKS